MRILITGGMGFIGWNLVQALKDHHEIYVLDSAITGTNVYERTSPAPGTPGVKFITGDVRNRSSWSVINHIKFDRVYHCACPASPKHYQAHPLYTIDTAYLGTKNVLEYASEWNARVLLTSTSEVYGDPAVSPQPEAYWGNVNSYGPRAMYDEGKRVGEALAWVYETRLVDVRIARIFNTYGPGMANNDGRMIPEFINAALAGKPLPVFGSGNQKRSITYVDDTVRGLIALMESDVRGPVNIGSDVELTVLGIAETINRIAGNENWVSWHPGAKDDPQQRCPDLTRARELLGWERETSIDVGLRKTIAWFRGRAASPSAS